MDTRPLNGDPGETLSTADTVGHLAEDAGLTDGEFTA